MATTTLSNHFKYMLAKAEIDFDAHTFKIILMNNSFTFNKDTHEMYSSVSASELAAGNGYTVGGATLTGVTITEDDTNDRCNVTWNSITWSASGGSIGPTNGAIIYDDTEATDTLVGYIDFGTAQTVTDGGTLTINNIEVRIA